MSTSGVVQTSLATQALTEFGQPINLNVVNKANDWSTRQEIAYNAIIGLIGEDFHGLQDFNNQMAQYSATNFILQGAYNVIRYQIPYNASIKEKLVDIEGLGVVGNFFLTIPGYQSLFVISPDAASDSSTLDSTIQSLL